MTDSSDTTRVEGTRSEDQPEPQFDRPTAISIVNATHGDPNGSAYYPPTEEHPYWRDPEKERVTVKEVWAGADAETVQLVFDRTFQFFVDDYSAKFRKAQVEGRIFRGGGHADLLGELQSQLGRGHWRTSGG